MADWDGSNAVRIAEGEYWGEGPIWSPDGRYLAFRDLARDVVISDPEGNVIAEFPGEGWEIAWSPDLTRARSGSTSSKQSASSGSTASGRRCSPCHVNCLRGDHDPVWLPDGESLLVPGVVVPIDGSAPYKPGRGASVVFGRDAAAAFGTKSPDGSRVAYVARGSLVVAEADGSNPREVFDDTAKNRIWSPIGDRIAFTTWKRGSGAMDQLRVLDVATGAVTLLAEADGSEDLEVIDFSPEGDRIHFARLKGPIGAGSLWSVKADGSDLRRVVAVAWGDWLSLGRTP